MISPEIENCGNEQLKADALAAIERGTKRDMNETYLACMNYNKKVKQREMLKERKEAFVKCRRWFTNSI
jgi:hypothetical protein